MSANFKTNRKMEILQLPRRGGKTTYLIERSARTGEIIVCFDSNEAERVFDYAKYMGIEIPKPVTFADMMRYSERGRNPAGYIIDNIDIILTRLTGVKFNLATISSNQQQ